MLVTTLLSTGLASFSNPQTIGAMYPGVGVEWLLVLLLFLAWVIWHVIQLRGEGRRLKKEAEHFHQIGLDKTLDPTQRETRGR